MMFKKSALFIWLVLLVAVVLPAQEGNSLVEEIFLIHNLNESLTNPPDQIRIRIDVTAPAYYKLLKEDTIISAGLFPKGANSLSLPTESLFEKTATHLFLLELKTDQGITRKEIRLDIQMVVMEAPKKPEPEKVISEHKLSLYIEDQLVSTRIKQQEIVPSIQKDLAATERGEDPFYVPKESDIQMRNTVSILQVLGLAYQIVKSVTKNKDKEETAPALEYTHSITMKFLKKNPQGQQEEVIAMIGLTTK